MGVDGGATASWIQAIQPGFATNPILINPIGGNVGIGLTTFAPSTLLHIAKTATNDDVASASQFQIGVDSNVTYGLKLGYYGTTSGWLSGVVQVWQGAAGGNLLLQPSAGNVVIGGTAPQSILTIRQIASGAVGPVITLDNSTGALQDAGAIRFYDASIRGELRFSVESSPFGADLIYFGGAAGATEVFRATSAGSFSIGAGYNPAARIHLLTPSGVAATMRLQGAGTTDSVSLEFIGGSANCYWNILTNRADALGAGDTIGFYKNTGTVGPKLVITDAGKVGVATASPGNRFTIADRSSVAGDALSGVAGFSLSAQTGATTDDCLLMGCHAGDYSWIQAARPGTATRSLLLNPNGGKVGVCTLAPVGLLSINPQVTPASVAAATQVTIGEQGSNSNYYLALGYMYDGANWGSSIQSIATGAPTNLILNGLGGRVAIGLIAPGYALDIAGDCNVSGTFRVAGVPLSFGTPTKTAFPFAAGWANYGSGLSPATYAKNAVGELVMWGTITGATGTGWVTIGTLPAGYRPIVSEKYASIAGFSGGGNTPTASNLKVDINGVVAIYNAGGAGTLYMIDCRIPLY